MDQSERLQFSSLRTNLSMPGENKEGPGHVSPNHSGLAHTSVVSNSLGDVLPGTNLDPSHGGSINVPLLPSTPLGESRGSIISGLDGFREDILAKGVSEDTAELLSSYSWRQGTKNAYNSAWSQWSSWCVQRKIDPFRAPVASVADYLTDLYMKGRCYRTLNNHRSAISAFHQPIDGCKVGQHELVCKVLNACFNARPPQPKYVVTWDVDVVLSYICSLGPNDTLSDKQLTQKLSMLLALASAGRSSDIRALDLNYMTVSEGAITFELGKLTKSRRNGEGPIKLTFHVFAENPMLCVVSTLLYYKERTFQWRAGCNKSQLLLSFVKPHKEIVPCTIAGWLVQVMTNAGIDTSTFKAHSTRGASTSKARAKGLSCQEIMAMAKWKKASTFQRHYLRKVVNGKEGEDGHVSFQKTVFQEGQKL